MSAKKDSTPEISPDLARQLQALREAYAARLDEKIESVESAWNSFCTLPEGEEKTEALTLAHRLTHSLAGSGATFGFPDISKHARTAEIVLKAILHDGREFGDEEKVAIATAYVALKKAAQLESDENSLDEVKRVSESAFTPAVREIFLLSNGAEVPPTWMLSLIAFGYKVECFSSVEDLTQACAQRLPCALLVDCHGRPFQMVRQSPKLSALLTDLTQTPEKSVPLLWICREGDIQSRLQAVRLGGAAFFTHPVDVDLLLVKLDDLTNYQMPEPFRVLIVEDEPALARLFSLILRQAGMETLEVTNPLEVVAPLVDFRPDLILMDVYMPGCHGTELAAVIRQQEAYVGIPIVFLSVETDVTRQMDAMRKGGDDFLIKPVQPRHLVAAVTTRVARARVLRNLMQRDSLTGLLNHTKTKEQLNIEIDRVKRLGHSITLAMIDIDHFKVVNDSYGHATGDRVLRALARLLGQRLRQTDVIGRYGGEEFAVILSGTDSANAFKVLDSIRDSFSQMVHLYGDSEFQVTFSAGIASAPPYASAEVISEKADKACYQAKREGRNRVTISD